MSVITSKTESPAVTKPGDVIDTYIGALENPRLDEPVSKMGIELEFNLYDSKTLGPLTVEQSEGLIARAANEGVTINHEPTAATLEIISDPFAPEHVQDLINQTNHCFSYFYQKARKNGLFPSSFAHLPHVRPEEHHMITNERYLAFWVPPRDDMIGAYESFLDPSIQVSISYKTREHLLQIIRLCIALEPFIMLSTDASGGFFNGEAVNYCPRLYTLPRRGVNGGIPDFYYTARTGKELIENHVDHIFNSPHVFTAFNFDGQLVQLPNGAWPSYLELEEQGFGPLNLLNYRQAQSESWRRGANIAEIRDEDGHVFGYRAEISSLFATGLQHQRMSALMMSYLIAYDENFYEKTSALLKEHGIDLEQLDASKTLLEMNYESATYHQGKFYELPFGTKTLKDFALSFADIVEECVTGGAFEEYAVPLLHIWRSGRPDWLVYREHLRTLDDVKNYLAKLPGLTKEVPELLCAENCADFTMPEIAKRIAA